MAAVTETRTVIIVTSATISPNPVNINTSTKIAVKVSEETFEVTNLFYSNEIYSGEVQ